MVRFMQRGPDLLSILDPYKAISASTFKEISLFWRNLRNFERLKEFFKDFQKFKESQGNLRKMYATGPRSSIHPWPI